MRVAFPELNSYILENLYMDPDEYLKNVKGVVIADD